MKANSTVNECSLFEQLPNTEKLFSMLPMCLKLPLEVRSRVATAARKRAEDVRNGYFGDNPLPKEMPRAARARLGGDLRAFWWALSVIDLRPEYCARAVIADLVAAASGNN